MILYKKYIKTQDKEIKFSISFNKDLRNWATGQDKKIGYYLNATPVERTQREGYSIEEVGCFTGFNTCLYEIDRQSSKRLDQAIEMLQQREEEFLTYFK